MYDESITTARLELERCTHANVDLRRLFEVFDADREGAADEFEYLPWEPHETVYDTKQWVDEQERRWRECDGATYLMRARESMDVDAGTLVGITSLETYWERKAGEQIIFLRRPFYGQGLFAESSYELLDVAFTELGIELMIADAVEGNARARSIFQNGVEAFGGQYDGVIRNRLPTDDGPKDVHRYTVTRDQYRDTMGLDDADDHEDPDDRGEATDSGERGEATDSGERDEATDSGERDEATDSGERGEDEEAEAPAIAE
ncbi:GNAT family protein [Halorubellus litoreus]|uniref:GNAT family protein n=1 Tax=Halorubellus litoreus TaxID=755308 RepID=A0ABD5VFU3_9EURY